MNSNGSKAIATGDQDLTPVIARSILDSLQQAGSRGPSTSVSTSPSLLAFATTLEKLVASSPALKQTIEEAMARSARLALASRDVALPSVDDFLFGMRNPVTARGGTVVRAFWWGWHVQISHEDLDTFLASAEPINAVIGAIGGGIPSPAAPFIALAAAFIAGALGLLKSLDRGSGVYVSMSWFLPGIFVPTSV